VWTVLDRETAWRSLRGSDLDQPWGTRSVEQEGGECLKKGLGWGNSVRVKREETAVLKWQARAGRFFGGKAYVTHQGEFTKISRREKIGYLVLIG